MKKTKIRSPDSAEHRTAPRNTDEYLSRVPEPALTTLKKVRAAIRSAAPKEATEALSYGIPTFKYKGNLVAFGAFKKHCSLFPMSYAVIEEFRKDLKDFTISKGTIRFPLDKPLPGAVLKKMVRARVAEMDR